MMNFEERRAEIFRRSDERIKIRKRNRKRILLGCVPIALCVGIFSVAFSQGLLVTTDKTSIENNAGTFVNEYSLSYPVYVELTDLNSGEIYNIEAANRIIPITDIIFSVTEGRARLPLYQYGLIIDNYIESVYGEEHKGFSKTNFYEITITRENETGIDKVNNFTLKGNRLTDKDTGQEYLLSNEELEVLLYHLSYTDK